MAGLILPNMFINDDTKSKPKPLKQHQVILLKSLIPMIDGYMAGNGNGLEEDTMEKEARLLRTLCKLYFKPTKEITKLYGKYTEYPTLNKTSLTKDYHLVALLATRTAKDKEALKFCSDHLMQTEERRLIKQFQLQTSEENILIDSVRCTNRGMLVGMCHLTKYHLIYEAGSYPLVFNKKAKCVLSNGSGDSCVTASAAKVALRNIEKITRNNSVMIGRGLHVYFDNNGAKEDFKVYFSKSKVRDKLYLAIIAQAKLVGNNIVEKEGVFNSPRSGRALSTESAAVEEEDYDETSEKNEASEREEYTDSEKFQSTTETYEESEQHEGHDSDEDEEEDDHSSLNMFNSPGAAKNIYNVPDNSVESCKDHGDWQGFFDRVFKQVRDKVQISIQCEKMEQVSTDKYVDVPGRLFVTERYMCFATSQNVSENVVSISTIAKMQQKKWNVKHKRLVVTTRNGEVLKFAIHNMKDLSSVATAIASSRKKHDVYRGT
jgi:hypothetical protein